MPWNIGNTSVRNPWRIQAGLQVFAREFNGNLDGSEQESLFRDRLIDRGVLQAGATVPKEPAWHGRKWRSCFAKLGLITGKTYTRLGNVQISRQALAERGIGTGQAYQLTPAGARLLQAGDVTGAIADVFMRQLLRLESPSPTEEPIQGGPTKPLVLVLQMLSLLEQANEPGLNLVEIAAFVQTASGHKGIAERVARIVQYRQERSLLAGGRPRRDFDNDTINTEWSEAGLALQPRSLRDYADTTSRYCRMTGLLTLKGNRINLRDEKRAVIDAILASEPTFLAAPNPLDYLVDFYTGTAIPTDDPVTALDEIRTFARLLVGLRIEPTVDADALAGLAAQDLATYRYRIEEQYNLAVEDEFARGHAEPNSPRIDEVLAYLRYLNGDSGQDVSIGREERPTFLEWAVWRGLLTMNSLATRPSETRYFRLDADMMPIDHAPSGRPDIVMRYNELTLVVEVTMSAGSRQEATEGEPVRRHVADIVEQPDGKEIYGLFIAPRVDFNTAETFRIGVWYHGDNENPNYLNIVPLRLGQFIAIVESMKTVPYTPAGLKDLLDRCLIFRNAHAPTWLRQIDIEVNAWLPDN
ncbi:MAG TPA: AlwI family type II restriction endonuclease [Armatimonadota bacterium]|nr:AlwI family type II restriction endonuclease [Armatimonadota bacterium]